MLINENLDAYLADLGVSVVAGDVSGLGIFESPDQIVGDIGVSSEVSVLTKTSLFGNLEHGSDIEVDGNNYTVRGVRKIDDGVFCRITLTDE